MQVDTFTPRVYRENAFLITGLAVDAGGRAIRRYRDRRIAKGTLTSEIDAALEVLRDPARRLVHELFAVWRTDDADAGALREVVANHDRAVEAHRTALELELDGDDPGLRDDAWRRAMSLWAPLMNEQAMWNRLRSRVVDIDDPRLTLDDVDVLRETLPDLILDINARLAADGHAPERQRALMGEFAARAGLGRDRVDAALERSVAGTVARVGRACDAAQVETAADGEAGLAVLSRLDASVKPDIDVLQQVLGARHAATVRTRDHAAETYRLCAVRHYNAAGESSAPALVPHLQTALDLAVSPTRRERISSDLDVAVNATRANVRYPNMRPPARTAGGGARVSTGSGRPAEQANSRAMLKAAAAIGVLGAIPLVATIATGGALAPLIGLIIMIVIAVVFLVAAMEPVPVARGVALVAIGLTVIAIGVWWWGGPWVVLPGVFVTWTACSSLRERPAVHRLLSVATGVLLAGVGSLPWGGLWLGGDGLWGGGHVGLWLVGFGHLFVANGGVSLGDVRIRKDGTRATWAVLATLFMGAVWIWGGGGWPAFAMAVMLCLVTLSVLRGAPGGESVELLGCGMLLVVLAVLVVAGLRTIGVLAALVGGAGPPLFG